MENKISVEYLKEFKVKINKYINLYINNSINNIPQDTNIENGLNILLSQYDKLIGIFSLTYDGNDNDSNDDDGSDDDSSEYCSDQESTNSTDLDDF